MDELGGQLVHCSSFFTSGLFKMVWGVGKLNVVSSVSWSQRTGPGRAVTSLCWEEDRRGLMYRLAMVCSGF